MQSDLGCRVSWYFIDKAGSYCSLCGVYYCRIRLMTGVPIGNFNRFETFKVSLSGYSFG